MTFVHGYSAYANRRCHCQTCTEGHRVYQAKLRRERVLRLSRDPTLAPHGSFSTYTNWGCRCTACKAEAVAVRTEYRERTGR